jgi:hypothetical protein
MAKFLAKRTTDDPSLLPTMCEICGCVRPKREMKSMAVVYRMPGYDHAAQTGYASFQCDDKQHWGCTHEHALLAMLFCIFEHIHEGPHEAQGEELQHQVLIDIRTRLETYIEEVREEYSKEDGQ